MKQIGTEPVHVKEAKGDQGDTVVRWIRRWAHDPLQVQPAGLGVRGRWGRATVPEPVRVSNYQELDV